MAEEETEKPKRRRRKAAEDVPAGEVAPTEADVRAADEAADVVLEAEDEVDADTDVEVQAAETGAEPEAGAEAEQEPKPEAAAEAEAGAEAESEAEAKQAGAEAKPARRPRRAKAAEKAAEEEGGSDAGTAATSPKPAPRRRRAERDPNLPPPVVRAHAKYVRSSARKARLVCDHIRGKSVEEARAILAHTPRAVARDWSKLLESAIANAENNHELVGEDLYIKEVHADEGPTIKRFRPRAMGRATRIRKRTSHLTILLTPKE